MATQESNLLNLITLFRKLPRHLLVKVSVVIIS